MKVVNNIIFISFSATTVFIKLSHAFPLSEENDLNQNTKNIFSNNTITVPLISEMNLNYHGEIVLGTPGKKFNVIFDTGSADLWVPSIQCNSNGCLNHKKYNPNESSTYINNMDSFMIRYGTGSLSGNLVTDHLGINNVKVKNQVFGISTNEANFFAKMKFDGVFGLAYPHLSLKQKSPPIVKLLEQGYIDNLVFSFWFDKNSKHKNMGAELVLGGVNEKRYTGPIKFAPVSTKKYWELTFEGVNHMGNNIDIISNRAIVDTGTSLM
ncbi:hypothetical protein BB559_002001, partial [Furculomyces boomerangus]